MHDQIGTRTFPPAKMSLTSQKAQKRLVMILWGPCRRPIAPRLPGLCCSWTGHPSCTARWWFRPSTLAAFVLRSTHQRGQLGGPPRQRVLRHRSRATRQGDSHGRVPSSPAGLPLPIALLEVWRRSQLSGGSYRWSLRYEFDDAWIHGGVYVHVAGMTANTTRGCVGAAQMAPALKLKTILGSSLVYFFAAVACLVLCKGLWCSIHD